MGMVLVGIYALLTVAAAFGAGDATGRFVFLQLPLVLQTAFITAFLPPHLLERLAGVSWAVAYLAIWPPTALFFYTIGLLIDDVRAPRPD
jgi:hypothetical protein